ncbi:MAG: hypothetical protein NKF70_00255 [Methanobacterium sp. ERen5]|nr:MAG: hypothetical protein NKF70_00255 [Methanobacterium sp. ERen5]
MISPPVDDKNNAQDGRWYDEGRIEIIGDGIRPEDVKVEDNGGPNCDAPCHKY